MPMKGIRFLEVCKLGKGHLGDGKGWCLRNYTCVMSSIIRLLLKLTASSKPVVYAKYALLY